MTYDEWVRLGMTFEDWLAIGRANKYCGEPTCEMHDATATDAELENGNCVWVIRLDALMNPACE